MSIHRLIILVSVMLTVCGCSKSSPVTEMKHYPIENLEGIISKAGVALDSEVTAGGSASLRVSADKPVTVRLFETGDLDVENARLTYRAKVRARDVSGKVYLEMWCVFQGKGEFFSRGLQSSLSGTTEWVAPETSFFLKPGENPDNIKLNIVVEGTGTVWVDDIRLVSGPLK